MPSLGDYFANNIWGQQDAGTPDTSRFALPQPQQLPPQYTMPQVELNPVIPNQLPEVTARYSVPLRNGGELFATGQYQHMLGQGEQPSWGLHMGYRRRF